jgi:phosphatidylinositol-3-phosphatase
VKGYLTTRLQRATAAAATLTGKRFGLLVASSLVATSAIVASAMTSPSGVSPLAALVGQSLAADDTPAAGPAAVDSPSPAVGSAAPPASSSADSATPAGGESPPAPAPAPAPQTSVSTEAPEKSTAPTEPTPEAGLIKHVFVITLTSPGYEAAYGSASQMPYLSTDLRPRGELLSGYSLLDDAVLPNDIAAVSGQIPDADTKAGCPQFDDCVYPVEIPTIADQLTVARFDWRAYLEGMVDEESGKPDNCVYPGAEAAEPPAEGGYTSARNPFVHFHSLLDLGDCAANDVPLTALDADLRKTDATPNLTFISPTVCNAGSTAECPEGQAGGPAAADAFLAEWVPKVLASPAYKKDGLLIVAFNQLDPVATTTAEPGGSATPLKVGALLLSRFLSPGATDPKPYDPYSLLRSIEDLYGLSHLGAADGKKARSFASTAQLTGGTGD